LSVSEYRYILRIAGKDIEGSKKIIIALSQIKGIGYNLSQTILQSLNINSNMRIGFLTEKEVSDIEAAIKNPSLIEFQIGILIGERIMTRVQTSIC